MARHRNIRKLNIEEELEIDDYSSHGSYEDEDEQLTPGVSEYIFQRGTPHRTDGALQSQRNQTHLQTRNPKGKELPSEEFSQFDYERDDKRSVSTTTKFQGKEIKKIGQLKISDSKSPSRDNSKSPARKLNTKPNKLTNLELALSSEPTYKLHSRPSGAQIPINLAIVGHVDAGKSTLLGHLLHLLSLVSDRALKQYRQNSAISGKSSFAFAWILDETDEERERGVTMDVALANFTTENKSFNVIDSPGHKDFIPNMISGASRADVALLVVNSTRGEFETGFDLGGQTREHSLLLRALGINHVIVAVNKMDTIDWSQNRFEEVCNVLAAFLQKQVGFEKVTFVPVSGLLGVNLVKQVDSTHPLAKWYQGPSLVTVLDDLPLPPSMDDRPLRIVIGNVLKCSSNLLSISAKIETGFVDSGDKLFVMPDAMPATVKNLSNCNRVEVNDTACCFAGDQIQMTLSGQFEPDSVASGDILCRGGSELVRPTTNLTAKVVTFDVKTPILRGSRAELFVHSNRVLCTIVNLKSATDKTNKKISVKNPRILCKNMSAIVEISTEVPICIETFALSKTLGRIALRQQNTTIAAGIIEKTF